MRSRGLVPLDHGLEEFALDPEPGYGPAFRVIWQAGAAQLPLDGAQLDLVEPLTRWLIERGRGLPARMLADALTRKGYHVFRFDYRGTGDSAGNIEQFSPREWLDDIDAAVR